MAVVLNFLPNAPHCPRGPETGLHAVNFNNGTAMRDTDGVIWIRHDDITGQPPVWVSVRTGQYAELGDGHLVEDGEQITIVAGTN